ncbi:hypothetical protein CLG96_11450 [Sphingomonas oleivorans]|uniref:Uncharacterized protein n=1 Tax=Sphingomonas oleivorans TaxID=1735121 RepID=A0A2T5FVI3_9SPHN|nr:hypothetical protein CLG96_11450 [Sphingomonas oleivorans]
MMAHAGRWNQGKSSVGNDARPDRPDIFASTLRETDIAITRLRRADHGHGMMTAYDFEDSFLLTVQLMAFEFGLWRTGRPQPDCSFSAHR